MAQMEVSPTVEDHLEAIYRLEEKDRVASTGELVRRLGVAPSTVTNTVERV